MVNLSAAALENRTLYRVSEEELARVAAAERRELERRESAYHADQAPLDVRGRTVILVDDGLATGSSMLAAVAALPLLSPARVAVAVPVAPSSTVLSVDAWRTRSSVSRRRNPSWP